MNRVRVMIADDHAILLDAFRRLLEPEYDVVATVIDGQSLLREAEQLRPDVVLVDISMPLLNGLDATERLQEKLPEVRIVILTASEDPQLAAESIRRGADAFVLKKSASAELFEAIRKVLSGRTYVSASIVKISTLDFVTEAKRTASRQGLSPRRREVLQLLAEGKSMKEAADILGITPRTVAFHKYAMMEELGLKNGAELIQYAVNRHMLPPSASIKEFTNPRPGNGPVLI